jgi:hypothetical protein
MLDTRVSAEYSLGTPKISTLLCGQLKQPLGGWHCHSNEEVERAVRDGFYPKSLISAVTEFLNPCRDGKMHQHSFGLCQKKKIYDGRVT